MMGTFAAMLAKDRIATPEDRYRADVTGDIEAVDGVLKIVRISVNYTLEVKSDQVEQAKAAFEKYLPNCPAAQSVLGCIEITHDLQLANRPG